jgi:hypothetical protein
MFSEEESLRSSGNSNGGRRATAAELCILVQYSEEMEYGFAATFEPVQTAVITRIV